MIADGAAKDGVLEPCGEGWAVDAVGFTLGVDRREEGRLNGCGGAGEECGGEAVLGREGFRERV